MRDSRDIIVLDFETYGLDCEVDEAIEVAGKAYNGITFEPYPVEAGGEFCSMMRPLHPENLEKESAKKALSVNRKTPEEILAAPDQKTVWLKFVDWVKQYNPNGLAHTAPIVAGKNVEFDLGFVRVLNRLHLGKKKAVLFARNPVLELEDDLYRWFRSEPDLNSYKMDDVREFFGLSKEGAHSALVDARQTGELLMKFQKLYDNLRRARAKDGQPLVRFRGK